MQPFSLVKAKEIIEQNSQTNRNALKASIEQTQRYYNELVKAGRKGRLSHIYIYALRSHLLLQEPWFRIDFCDHRDFADVCDCYTFWDILPLSSWLYSTFPLKSALPDTLSNRDYPPDDLIEKKWMECFHQMIPLCGDALSCIVNELADAVPAQVVWHYGEYYGHTHVIAGGCN